MIPKILVFPGRSEKGIFTHLIDGEKNYLEKTAAEYHPTIASYIHGAKPIPGKIQILLTALGAGEYWGCNVNGDYFPEKALAHEGRDFGHKTFEYFAKYYKHHVNKDPKASYGDVVLSVYNPVYHRVELIVALDYRKSPETARKIENGDYPDWSMGCKVPYDVCSVCDNRAPTRAQYCDHARYMLGKIDPDTGKQVWVRNDFPRFHDISEVLIGADKIAKTLMKVASTYTTSSGIHLIGSAALAEKMAERNKAATIDKEVPADEPPASEQHVEELARNLPELKASEKSLPTGVLDRLATEPLPSSMSTMASMGILPKPQEFQRIIIRRMGRPGLADMLSRNNICFHPEMAGSHPEEKFEKILGLDHNRFDPRIMGYLSPFMPSRSCAAPHMAKRLVIMIKQASPEEELPVFIKTAADLDQFDWEKLGASELDKERKPLGILPVLMAAAGLYAAFGKKAPDEAVKGVDKLIMKHPGLAAALGVGLASTFGAMAGPKRQGQFSQGSYVNPDASNATDYVRRLSAKPITKSGAADFGKRTSGAFKRLFVGIPAAYLASGILQKHKELNPYGGQEGGVKSFLRKNPDVVSGALVADALLASRGKGTYAVTKTVMPKLQALANAFKGSFGPNPGTKTAAAGEAFAEAARGVAYPLAVGGGGSLPFRIVGGLADQAAFHLLQKAVDKKQATGNRPAGI